MSAENLLEELESRLSDLQLFEESIKHKEEDFDRSYAEIIAQYAQLREAAKGYIEWLREDGRNLARRIETDRQRQDELVVVIDEMEQMQRVARAANSLREHQTSIRVGSSDDRASQDWDGREVILLEALDIELRAWNFARSDESKRQ
jgi:hypothetical protein